MDWKQGKFSTYNTTVTGLVSARWGIERKGRGHYVLTHLKIGEAAGRFPTLAEAKAAAIPLDLLVGRCSTHAGARRHKTAGKRIRRRFRGRPI